MSFQLTHKQFEAIEFLKKAMLKKEKVVGLFGAGGVGKTSIVHKLLEMKDLNNISITITATTNKAASILRKDIPTAITMHKAISKFVPTELYTELENYFLSEGENTNGSKISLTDKTLDFLKEKSQDVKKLLTHEDVDSFFRNNDIGGYDPIVFSHYATAPYTGGVCVVDEASMLPAKSIYKKDENGSMKLQTIGLDILTGIYDTVILSGDSKQLPPISGTSSFEGINSVELTENFRSEKDLLRLLQYARDGKSLELFNPLKGESIRVLRRLPKKYIEASRDLNLDIVHIVFRNVTRQNITRMIRGQSSTPKKGEKIVYYGKNINDDKNNIYIAKNEIGIFDGIQGIWDNYDEFIQYDLFDEYPSNKKYSKYRYGYALTAHSAQGSSFDHGVVHLYDIPGFIDIETQIKWCYTAVSRFRKSVTIILSE